MLGSGGFGSNQNQPSSGGLFGTSTSFGTGIGQQGVNQNVNSSIQPSSGLFNSSNSIFTGNNANSNLFGNMGSSNSVFGSTSNTSNFGQSSNGLFGQSMGTFGNQQMSSTQPSIFGSNNNSNTGFFGSGSTGSSGVFGSFQNSFGSTGGFGNQSSQQNSTGFFGQQNTTGIFGSTATQGFGNTSTSPFGGSLGTTTNLFTNKKGTNGITFQPVVDRDSDARIMSIVYQKDVDQKKSVEELRWEDYQEKRGPTNSLPVSDNFSTNTTSNFGGNLFSSNSGIFGSNSQNSSISNSIFGKPQSNSFLGSTNSQVSLFGSGNSTSINLGQPSMLNQNFQSGQPNTGTSFQFGTNCNNNLFSSSATTGNSFSLQTSPNNTNTGLFSSSSGLFSTNNSGLFGQPSANSGIADNILKNTNSLFGASIATSANTSSSLFGSNPNTQSQLSFGGSTLGTRSLFDNSQNLTAPTTTNSIFGAGTDSSTTSLFASTQPITNNLIGTRANSTGLLFGSSSNQASGSASNSSSGIIGSNLFGQSSAFSQQNVSNNNSNSLLPNLNSLPTGLTGNTTNFTGSNLLSSNTSQLQNVLSGVNKNLSNSHNPSIPIGVSISNSNSVSTNSLSKPMSQSSSKYSDSADRTKSLWLWKPLPQYISRQNRYQLDSFNQLSSNDVSNSNSELALPALAAESARHNNLLLTSVRRIEKTTDSQTPATFLSLLERQQQFFDAIQSPDSSNSPNNTKTKSMVFTTSHASSYTNKFVPIDENFEDAIDDSNSTSFSPKLIKSDGKFALEGTKPLLNLESISRISQDIQFSKREDAGNSINRVSLDSSVRTPHLNQHRTSINSLISGERPHRTSIGLTTPRPILRNLDQIKKDTLASDLNKSNQHKQKEGIVESLTPILTKADYFCIPSIEVLKTFSEDRLSIVEDFKIVREGVGEIMWPGVTDLRGINLDLVVNIEHLCVSVYGDGDSVIPIGEGLNKKAVISLKNCKPKKILQSEDPQEVENFKNSRVQQIKLYTEQMGARFISLDTVTWEWKFEVSHFSRYGIINEENYSSFEITQEVEDRNLKSSENLPFCADRDILEKKFNFNSNSIGLNSIRETKDFDCYQNFQEKFNMYLEIKEIVEKNKDKCGMYSILSFRSGIFFGSNGIVVRPHKSANKKKGYTDYNTSITIYKLNQSSLSYNASSTQTPILPRRLISAWLRIYFEFIGNPRTKGNVTIEVVLKLVFLLWEITKKEFTLSLYNLKENRNLLFDSNGIRHIEETLCLLTGIFEIIFRSYNSSKILELNFNKMEGYISWWLKTVFSNRNTFKYLCGDQERLKCSFSETRIFTLFEQLTQGNLRNLLLTQNIESYLSIPRTTALCLSLSNKSSLSNLKENFRWWSSVGLVSDFSTAAFKMYSLITEIDNIFSIYNNWHLLLYFLINYSLKYSNSSQKFQLILQDIATNFRDKFLDESELKEFSVSRNEEKKNIFLEKTVSENIQFKIISFFFFEGEQRLKILRSLYNSSLDISSSFSFCWIVARILSLYHQLQDYENIKSSSKLSLLFIQELELLGMWEWATYVATHLSENNKFYSSNNIFINLIMRNISENKKLSSPHEYVESDSWKFLTGIIGIPLSWLLEAMMYKSSSYGDILQSLEFAIYLIDHIKDKEEYVLGDLFFQNKSANLTEAINSLILFTAEKLFDRSLMVRTLIEISIFLKRTIETRRHGNKVELGCKTQIKILKKLDLIIAEFINCKIISQELWNCITSMVSVAVKFVECALSFINESRIPRELEVNEISSLIQNILLFRSHGNSHSLIETSIHHAVNDECWEIMGDALKLIT